MLELLLLYSREEFTVFMSTVDIRSDRRRWMQVFRSIDVDFDSRVGTCDLLQKL
jgi:hypothetical protein